MSKLPILQASGTTAGEYDLAETLLVYDRGEQAVVDAVVAHMAARRQGSAHTKTKGEVAGSNKKPWKQKGTGRARAGLRQSPVWRGGGVAFGPRTRDYTKDMPRKKARLAFRRAFSEKVASGNVSILDVLNIKEGKTREVANLLASLNLPGKTLILTGEIHPALVRGARNIPTLEVIPANQVNTYQLLRNKSILLTRDGLAALEQRLATEPADMDVPSGSEQESTDA